MNVRNVIILIIIIVLLIVAFILYSRYDTKYTVITKGVRKASKEMKVTSKKILIAKPRYGLKSTFSFWMYINDWDYKYNKEKIIIKKGKFELGLRKRTNNIYLQIPTINGLEIMEFKNLPLQKWLHVVLIINNRDVEMWFNGELYASKFLKFIPKYLEKEDTYICPDGGFSGFTANIYHYNYPLNFNLIKKTYRLGNINLKELKICN
tara:strand:- start:4575 stop:5195 length:621 start_codon:yes stop_codon:yes gene_type:complete